MLTGRKENTQSKKDNRAETITDQVLQCGRRRKWKDAMETKVQRAGEGQRSVHTRPGKLHKRLSGKQVL